MMHLARYSLIVVAILVFPLWKLWIFCGWLADQHAQRRTK